MAASFSVRRMMGQKDLPAKQIVDDPLTLHASTGRCGIITIRLQQLDVIPLGQIRQRELPPGQEFIQEPDPAGVFPGGFRGDPGR